jgi:hypothetical protein
MPLKIIHPDHTEVMGIGVVLLSGPGIGGPRRDLYTGQIAEEAALQSKSWAIVAKERKPVQLEDMAQSDFGNAVKAFVEEYGIRCIIAITGTDEPGITIRGQERDSNSGEILEIIRSGLEPHFIINAFNRPSESGEASSPDKNQGADTPSGRVEFVQLELGPEERSFRKDQIVGSIADIVGLINAKLGFSESGSSALD